MEIGDWLIGDWRLGVCGLWFAFRRLPSAVPWRLIDA